MASGGSSSFSIDITVRPERDPRWQDVRRRGELLERRDPDPEYGEAVETYEFDGEMWLVDGDLGEIRIHRRPGKIEAWPLPGISEDELERRLRVDWLPIFYTLWGFQTVHASAVVHEDRTETLAFVGASGVGKSTLGYALGRRPGWTQLTDDATAFRAVDDAIELIPIPSESRLRPASARRFGRRPHVGEALPPHGLGVLSAIYFIVPSAEASDPVIRRLGASRALQQLLEQAFAFTLKKRSLRQQMVEDYFTLCATVPTYSLVYRREFAYLDPLLDAIEAHAEEQESARATG